MVNSVATTMDASLGGGGRVPRRAAGLAGLRGPRRASERAARAARAAGDGLLERVAPPGAAGHVLDFDDTYLPGIAHLSAPVAPAALVVGAPTAAPPSATCSTPTPPASRRWARWRARRHPRSTTAAGTRPRSAAPVGAAVAAARLLGLDDERERRGGRARAAARRRAARRVRLGRQGAAGRDGGGGRRRTPRGSPRPAPSSIAARRDRGRPASRTRSALRRATAGDGPPAIDENWIKP